MSEHREKPGADAPLDCGRRDTRAATWGAAAAILLIWVVIVGFHVWKGAWSDALFWGAIGVATSAGVWAPTLGRRRKT